MWCDILSDEPRRRTDANHIILYVNTSYRRKPGFTRLIAISPARDVFPDELVVPRFDLPRAWEPDGSPVKGYWETSFDWGFIPQTRRYVTDPIPLEEDERRSDNKQR